MVLAPRVSVSTAGTLAGRAGTGLPRMRSLIQTPRNTGDVLVPLAVKQLGETGARIWTLAGEPFAVAVAIPLELQA